MARLSLTSDLGIRESFSHRLCENRKEEYATSTAQAQVPLIGHQQQHQQHKNKINAIQTHEGTEINVLKD